MNREFRLSDLEARCYRHFEYVWLEELKEILAYFNWVRSREKGEHFWCSDDKKQSHHRMACDEVRSFLIDPTVKATPSEFATIREYILREYLDSGGRANGPHANELVAVKCGLLLRNRARDLNQADAIARQFVKGFYENIVKAAQNLDREAALGVLRSLAYGGSANGLPSIINCFETILAVSYLPAAVVKDAWMDDRTGIQRQTTF
jgi:hypothetical protein